MNIKKSNKIFLSKLLNFYKKIKNKIIEIIIIEAKDNKKLAKLLIKITKKRNITNEEKHQIIEQLSDNVKLILYSILIFLPGSSFLIPIILFVANKLNINYKTNKTFDD